MVPVRHADFGIGPAGLLLRHHERADARHVGLVRQRQEIEHQPAVILDTVRERRRDRSTTGSSRLLCPSAV